MDSARWAAFVARPDDMLIFTAYKPGTTWLQMICSLLIFRGDPPAPLAELSPWLDLRP